MLRIVQGNNSQLLNLTVFHSFLKYFCKFVSLLCEHRGIDQHFFGCYFSSTFYFTTQPIKFVSFIITQLYWHTLPEDLGMVGTCTMESGQKLQWG